MREWLLYAPSHQLNEATRQYIATIAEAARLMNRSLRHVMRLSEVPLQADVLTVECKSAFKLCVARPHTRKWIWVQGIVPEEALMQFNSRWREALWTMFERVALPRSNGVFMVSRAMREHFAHKYGFASLPVFVMPCANSHLDPAVFDEPGKYSHPSFVYAGSMHRWQCFELTLEVFRRVQEKLPQATLTVLTSESNTAARWVTKAGIKKVEIDFVPLSQLQAVLRRFKYGFVLREPHVVNQVATPTKVSSYMAAGVIPIMTDVISDYRQALSNVRPMVLARRSDAQEIAEAVLAQEAQLLSPDEVRRAYKTAFDEYFDHGSYIEPLRQFLSDTGLAGQPDNVA